MSVSPANKTLFVGESVQFSVSGGTAPYIFVIASGIGSVSSNGFYTAPSVPGASVIKATDSLGEEAYATVSVAVQISLSPTSATINEGDTVNMSGSGGIPPYTYSIVAGDGSINSLTGLYDATGVTSGSAVIEVRDSSANAAFAAITINASLIISPQVQTIGYSEQISFSATGGDIPYTYSILTGAGTINSTTGQFVGPSTVGSTVVRVTDNSGNSVDAIISIIDSPQIDRPRDKVAINRTVTFTATNGSPSYTFSIVSGAGSIHPTTGIFTAPSDTATTVVQVKDINNYTDSTSITTFVPKKLGTGDGHTCVIDFSDVNTSISKCWGRSSYGLGNGGHAGPEKNYFLMDDVSEFGDSLPTVDLGSGVQVRGVKVGRYSTCAVTTDDKMKCFGYNNYGQLGLGDRTYRGFAKSHMGSSLEFVDLGTGRKVNNTLPFEHVLSVNYHSVCVILDDNSTKCWGIGNKGKTGHANTATRGDGATEVGDGIPVLDFAGDNAIQISVGLEHTCAVLQNNNVKCWGESGYGELGRNSTTDQIKAPKDITPIDLGTGHTATKVSTGYYHTCAVLDDGNVKCWGRNNYGQLGYGSTTSLGDDLLEMGDNLGYVDLGTSKTALDIELQGYSSCALLNDNTVKCWGYNGYGNLGIGSNANTGDASSEMGDVLITVDLGAGRTATKIFSGINQTCAKLDNGDVKCWGRNNTAQLGQGHTFDIGKSALSLGDNLDPINLSSTASINTIQSNEYTTCAVLSDNTLKCFGADYYGSRGTGSSIIGDESADMGSNLPALNLGTNNPFKDIRSEQFLTCGQTTDNKLACWGYAGEGSRGSGNTTNKGYISDHWGDNLEFVNFGTGGLTVKTFDVGYRGACAILSDDSLACWGRNDNGAGGHGTTADKGDAANEIGDNFLFTDLGNVSTPVEVSRSFYNTCVRFANGGIKCWGNGTYGQNGIGNTAQKGDGSGEMGNSLPFINYGTGITSTALCGGEQFNCSLFNNGGVKCWGRNNRGQLGIGSTTSIGDSASELGDNLAFVDLGTGRTATKIACGRYHTCALLDNEKLKCWGEADQGQLGNGSTADIGNAPGEMGDNLPEINVGTDRLVLDISAGEQFTCAVLDDNSVKCWGRNSEGQLGLGHLTNIGTLDVTMGDSLPAVDTE
jgi:alpha-tubulin suppressor-like RCC1 family protein